MCRPIRALMPKYTSARTSFANACSWSQRSALRQPPLNPSLTSWLSLGWISSAVQLLPAPGTSYRIQSQSEPPSRRLMPLPPGLPPAPDSAFRALTSFGCWRSWLMMLQPFVPVVTPSTAQEQACL